MTDSVSVKPVRILGLPYEVTISKHQHHKAESWCRANLGPRWEVFSNHTGTWCCFWAGFQQGGDYRYHFESERTAVEFALRWAGT
jgi:hypothetical protein